VLTAVPNIWRSIILDDHPGQVRRENAQLNDTGA
jgi:hypothetical protein